MLAQTVSFSHLAHRIEKEIIPSENLPLPCGFPLPPMGLQSIMVQDEGDCTLQAPLPSPDSSQSCGHTHKHFLCWLGCRMILWKDLSADHMVLCSAQN